MLPFPDCAIARFVVCCSERVAPVVLSRQQNAILRRGRCKRHCVPPAGTNLLGDMDRSVPRGTGLCFGRRRTLRDRLLTLVLDVPW